MKTFKSLIACAIAALGASSASAVVFTLDSSSATINDSNPQSSFFQIDLPSTESGTPAGLSLFNWTTGGNNSTGFWIEFTWGTEPQPFITGAEIKSGNANATLGGVSALIWDATDFVPFNAGVFDGIRLIQDGIFHKSNGQLLGISHSGLDGRPGTTTTKVPDAGTSVVLLGAGLLGIGALRRRLAK